VVRKLNDHFSVAYMMDERWFAEHSNESLPEALAMMYLWLRKEGLI